MRELTLGSLFDGAGGFPFAAQHYGIKPIWASEIEKFPIEVTTKNFPEMKHLGDVSKINGADIDPVDIITFGSPCQDLSNAAPVRKGLAGERSGLFHQAIRIIKEMRKATNGIYPRIAVWENVYGAFSSNKGEDFRCVLEEFCKISQDDAYVPKPKKWGGAGHILGNGYSVAWRVLDARFHGVPQRRRRVFLVASFGSERAGEILFKREGLSRNFAEIRESWQGTTKTFAFSSSSSVKCDFGRDCGENVTAVTYRKQAHPTNKEDGQGYEETSTADTLNTTDNSESRTPILVVCNGDCDGKDCVISVENRNHDSGIKIIEDGNAQTLYAGMGTGGNNAPYVLLCVRERCGKEGGGKGCLVYDDNHSGSLACSSDQFVLLSAADCYHNLITGDKSRTVLTQGDHINQPCLIYAVGGVSSAQDRPVYYCTPGKLTRWGGRVEVNQASTLTTGGGDNTPTIFYFCKKNVVLRRLTPTECGRLQGMPDWWCDGIPHSDSAEYKLWGNGMALPCVLYVMEGVKEVLENDSSTEK